MMASTILAVLSALLFCAIGIISHVLHYLNPNFFYKIIFVCSDDMCDCIESTRCFAEWTRQKVILSEEYLARDAGSNEGSLQLLPEDCREKLVVPVICKGGYGVCDGIMVPVDTKEGMYALEIKDNVLQECMSTDDEIQSLADSQYPRSADNKCRLVSPLQIFRSILISVVAPDAAS